MNREEKIKRWQASIDDALLEEAQRPLPRGRAALRWGSLAASLCAAALALVLALPGHGAAETEDCGAAPDGSAVYKSFSASAAPCECRMARYSSAASPLPPAINRLTVADESVMFSSVLKCST